MLDIEQIRARLAAATPGPWMEWAESGDYWIGRCCDDVPEKDAEWVCDSGDMSDENTEFVAHAPSDIAALIKELEAARAFIEEAEYAASHDCEEPTYTLQTALNEYEKAIAE